MKKKIKLGVPPWLWPSKELPANLDTPKCSVLSFLFMVLDFLAIGVPLKCRRFYPCVRPSMRAFPGPGRQLPSSFLIFGNQQILFFPEKNVCRRPSECISKRYLDFRRSRADGRASLHVENATADGRARLQVENLTVYGQVSLHSESPQSSTHPQFVFPASGRGVGNKNAFTR